MNAPTQSFMLALLAAMLLGVWGCSDNGSAEKVGQKIDQAAEAAKEKLAPSSDASRRATAKTDAAIDDMALAARVKAEIGKDSALKTSDISVDSRDGTVVLSGIVERSEDVIRAVRIARDVDNVKSVESKLVVRSEG